MEQNNIVQNNVNIDYEFIEFEKSNNDKDVNETINRFDSYDKLYNMEGLIVEENTVYEFDEECLECLKNKK